MIMSFTTRRLASLAGREVKRGEKGLRGNYRCYADVYAINELTRVHWPVVSLGVVTQVERKIGPSTKGWI